MEEHRTDIIQTPAPGPAARVTDVTTTAADVPARPRAHVDQQEAVAYDPYASKRLAAYRVTQTIYWVFGLIDALILIRFILKALGANPTAGFAEFIYGVTAVFVAPFVGLFGNPQAQGNVLEVTSLVALIVYALLAYLLGKLAWIITGDTRSAIHTRTNSIDSRL